MPQNKGKLEVRKTGIRRFDRQMWVAAANGSLNSYQKIRKEMTISRNEIYRRNKYDVLINYEAISFFFARALTETCLKGLQVRVMKNFHVHNNTKSDQEVGFNKRQVCCQSKIWHSWHRMGRTHSKINALRIS